MGHPAPLHSRVDSRVGFGCIVLPLPWVRCEHAAEVFNHLGRHASDQFLLQAAGLINEVRAGYLEQFLPVRFPHTPGPDVAGIVAELGDGVTAPPIGAPVIGFLPMNEDGAAAEFVVAPAAVLTRAPCSIALALAAALLAGALTAWQALFEHARLQRGQRVLVNGAGGGVGGVAVQFAKQVGATVIATASPRSAAAVRAAGADQLVDYTTTKVSDAIGAPVDVVVNLVTASEEDMAALVGLVRAGGVLVTTASPAPEDPERNVRCIHMRVRSDAAQLADIVARVDAGDVKVDVSATYPLDDIVRVHQLGAAGDFRGKVLLVPTS
jgi:NADPH:quinone reductase-like Zn-dependent oxidoreductase